MLFAYAICSGPKVYICERTWLEITAESLQVIQEALYLGKNNTSDINRTGIFIS
jgi:hypothetical protein